MYLYLSSYFHISPFFYFLLFKDAFTGLFHCMNIILLYLLKPPISHRWPLKLCHIHVSLMKWLCWSCAASVILWLCTYSRNGQNCLQPRAQNLDLKCNIFVSQFADQVSGCLVFYMPYRPLGLFSHIKLPDTAHWHKLQPQAFAFSFYLTSFSPTRYL